MKCGICGKTGYRDIAAIGRHYRDKHPRSMSRKRNTSTGRKHKDAAADESLVYRILKRERLI